MYVALWKVPLVLKGLIISFFCFQKPLREKLNDAKFLTGPLIHLNWSKWYLAICDSRPKGASHKKYKYMKNYGTYNNQWLFGKDIADPAIYEVGLAFPQKTRKKIHAVYFKRSLGIHKPRRADILCIVHTKRVQREMTSHVGKMFQIYIRRGTGCRAEVKSVSRHLLSIDYAWGWYRKTAFRKVQLF